jgi:hypothetical protein
MKLISAKRSIAKLSQANVVLTKELERFKEMEKGFESV